MNWPDAIFRATAGLAALPVLYVAWCVYEDEEKTLQSRIEDWWLQFDDLGKTVVARQAAFVRVVAVKSVAVLDSIFGPKNFSFDALSSSAILCVAGIAITTLFDPLLGSDLEWRQLQTTAPVFFFVALLLFVLPRSAKRILGVRGFLLLRPSYLLPFLGAAVVLCAVLTMVLVAIERWALARAARTASERPILVGMLIFLAMVPICWLLLLLGLVLFAFASGYFLGAFLSAIFVFAAIGAAATIPVGLFLLVVGIAVGLLLHRAAWPLMSRLLYNLPRNAVVEHKAALKALSVFLLGIACTGIHGWQPLLKLLHLSG